MASERVPYVLQAIRDILTVIVVPVMAWLLYSTMEIKLDIVKLQSCTTTLASKIDTHSSDTKSDAESVAQLHHSAKISKLCMGCH